MTDDHTDSGPRAVIGEMADLRSQHKLVPFFGAGISRQHLGLAAAELAREMAEEIGHAPETLLADTADAYAEARGSAAFVDFLNRKLVVTELDERKTPSHRLLVSLMQSVLYTTNQDNLFEFVALKYGRKYRRVGSRYIRSAAREPRRRNGLAVARWATASDLQGTKEPNVSN